MTELTAWESVQHAKPTAELEKLVGVANSFASWPPYYKAEVVKSLKQGVALGHVDQQRVQDAIVGTVDYVQADTLELRARWEPAKS